MGSSFSHLGHEGSLGAVGRELCRAPGAHSQLSIIPSPRTGTVHSWGTVSTAQSPLGTVSTSSPPQGRAVTPRAPVLSPGDPRVWGRGSGSTGGLPGGINQRFPPPVSPSRPRSVSPSPGGGRKSRLAPGAPRAQEWGWDGMGRWTRIGGAGQRGPGLSEGQNKVKAV